MSRGPLTDARRDAVDAATIIHDEHAILAANDGHGRELLADEQAAQDREQDDVKRREPNAKLRARYLARLISTRRTILEAVLRRKELRLPAAPIASPNGAAYWQANTITEREKKFARALV